MAEKRALVDRKGCKISIHRQCELLEIHRSGLYYQSKPESAENLEIMNLIDGMFTQRPYNGKRVMTANLRRMGYKVNCKRIGRLMRLMGLEAIYPKPNLSKANREHKKYPYLLKGVVIDKPGKVLSADITYIRLEKGFAYLVAVIDWFSRYVHAWRLSPLLDTEFCIEAIEEALMDVQPEIFNTDQGVQFTSTRFTEVLERRNIAISMDGKGRALDNVFIERLWRSVKYEEVYLKDYKTMNDAETGLGTYFKYYNQNRPHQSLDYRTPYEVHFGI